MSGTKVTVVAIILFFVQGRVKASGLVEMISDYAKVVKNTDRITTREPNNSIVTEPPTTSEPTYDYQDFDDLQAHEEDRSLKQTTSSDTMMKYFNGLVSLLALMYKFNGNFKNGQPPKHHLTSQSEPRDNQLHEEGKKFQTAQERFEFPQKKFKNHDVSNIADQQFQPVENYPPYNPYKANSAETYNQDDKKTSYDVDLMQYDLTKNSVNDYSNVNIQQSYSYKIPYENSNTVSNDDSTSWNSHYHYNSYTEKPATNENFYSFWKAKPPSGNKLAADEDSYQPWKSKTPDFKPATEDSESRQPWHGKPIDFPIYNHDFKDAPQVDHHLEYHDIEHEKDEDRVSKKPYSYYFLGRKLWYVPLLFSVYFIIYIGALVLKSVARHKIQFPEKVWNLHDEHFGHGKRRRHRKIDDVTESYENAVEKMSNKFM